MLGIRKISHSRHLEQALVYNQERHQPEQVTPTSNLSARPTPNMGLTKALSQKRGELRLN
jgi:hypothetical protein